MGALDERVIDCAFVTRGRATALLAGGAALCATASTSWAQGPASLRVATIPLESAAEIFYARDMGFLTKAGLDAEIQTMVNGTSIAAAIVSAAVDIGYVTVDALASIHQKGISLAIIAPCTEYLSPAFTGALLVAANSAIHTGKDLNGKIVAVVALNGITHLATRAWIDQHGGDSTTVKSVEIPFPSITAALAAGRVDAAYAGEPFLEIAKPTTRVLFYGTDSVAKHYLSSAWCAAPAWANDHLNIVNRYAAAMHDTAAWATKNPAKSGELYATYSKTDPTLIAGTPRVRFTQDFSPAFIQPVIDVSAKYNGFRTFPAQEIIYTPSR